MPSSETATALLREEHQRILGVADVLETLLQSVDRGEEPDLDSLADCVAFIRLFADAVHHGKEEDLLFPQLEARGVPRHTGPIAVMLQEHEIGRAFARKMSQALPAMREGDTDAWESIRTAGYGFIELIRNKDIRRRIFPRARTPEDRRRASGRTTRLLRLLRAHGLLRKVSHTFNYRVTTKGQHLMATALKLRQTSFLTLAT